MVAGGGRGAARARKKRMKKQERMRFPAKIKPVMISWRGGVCNTIGHSSAGGDRCEGLKCTVKTG